MDKLAEGVAQEQEVRSLVEYLEGAILTQAQASWFLAALLEPIPPFCEGLLFCLRAKNMEPVNGGLRPSLIQATFLLFRFIGIWYVVITMESQG